MEVAPPDAIGASFAIYLASIGAETRVTTSLIMFDIRAIAPIASPLILPIIMLDRL